MAGSRLYVLDPDGAIRERCAFVDTQDVRSYRDSEAFFSGLEEMAAPGALLVDARGLTDAEADAIAAFLSSRPCLALVLTSDRAAGRLWLQRGASDYATDTEEVAEVDARVRGLVELRARFLSPGYQRLIQASFLRSFSHDMKTSLNAIFGFAELMLMDEELHDQARIDVGRILRNAQIVLSGLDRLASHASEARSVSEVNEVLG